MAYYETLPADAFFITNDPDGLCTYFLYGAIGGMVDEKAGTCSFDDGRLAKIIRFCEEKGKTVRKEADYADKRDDRLTKLRDGKLTLLTTLPINSLYEWAKLKWQFGGTVIPVGYPNEDGAVLAEPTMNTCAGITAVSVHKAEALDFLGEFYRSKPLYGYASNTNWLSRLTSAPGFTRSDLYAQADTLEGYTVVSKSEDLRTVSLVPDDEAGNYPVQIKITRKDADEFADFLDSIEGIASLNGPIWEIMREELFSDPSETPEVRAARVQSRASLYLAEQK